jgi:NhaP-type Na+/H+ or K+/H+ antiporter
VIPEGFANIATLGLVLLLFELCDLFLPESGILAVTVAGVVVGNFPGIRTGKELGEFEEYLTVALIALLFVLLAADVRLSTVLGLGWSGIATVSALVLLVRPLNVLASTYGSELDWRRAGLPLLGGTPGCGGCGHRLPVRRRPRW